jgi:Lon protease-like protein
MVQPNGGDPGKPDLFTVGCAGRITQIAETGDGRYMLALTGVARFRVVTELDATTLYRQCHVDFASFAEDFLETRGIETVDRKAVLDALRCFAEAHRLEINWRGIEEAPNDALVNALAMMSPFGPREKQALLEASDIKTRAEVLVAITEMELARSRQAETRLQ